MIRKNKLYPVVMASLALILLLILVSSASAAPVTSKVVSTHYKCSSWSNEQYPLINVFGENYVPLIVKNDPLWKCHVDKLARLVLDTNIKYSMVTGQTLYLGSGYSLQAKQVDLDSKKVWLELDKDGQYIDDAIVDTTNENTRTWTCTLDKIMGMDNVPVLKVHVKQVYEGEVYSEAEIDGIWLIDYASSKTLIKGDKFGKFTLINIVYGVSASNPGSLVFDQNNPILTETRISYSGSSMGPKIYGNKTVWSDKRNGNYDIFIYDLSSKKQTSIVNLGDQFSPDIYNNQIVWVDYRNGYDNSDIYMYDLATKKQTKITSSGKADQPHIYGNRVIWLDSRNGGDDVYMYDLSTRKEVQITTSGHASDPIIYGNRIVFKEGGIYMYDISTKKKTQITSSGYSEDELAFYGNIIAWHDSRNGVCNIYMYDLITRKVTQIPTFYADAHSPAIYGNKIVWDGNFDIYMYDLSTKYETRISNSGKAEGPAIYNNKIVWADNRNGSTNVDSYDIYMAALK